MSDSDSIYRFLNLYELYELIVCQRLKFTKLRLMSDRNEGLGEVFRAQSTEIGFMLRNDQKLIRAHHQQLQEEVYVSCWTISPDAMAMWLLYSTDQSSIRVRTSLKKLTDCIKANEAYLDHRLRAPAGTLLPRMGYCETVKYVDFKTLHSKKKAKLIQYYLDIKAALHQESEGRLAEIHTEHEKDNVQDLKYGCLLKDSAYSHEQEVRGIFHMGVRNGMSVDQYDKLPDTMSKIFGSVLIDSPTLANSADVFFAEVPTSFVDEICFDPRMPKYKRTVIEKILAQSDLQTVDSTAFGYLIDELNLTVPEDDYL
jgi:hypothetical protein